jgi:hypothetical protein
MDDSYEIFVRKRDWERTVGRPENVLKDNIKMILNNYILNSGLGSSG